MYIFGRFCRICLEKPKSLFDFATRTADDINVNYYDMLECVYPDLISLDENLPELICPKCCTQLDAAYLFHKKCLQSFLTLQNYTKSLKNETDCHSNNSNFPANRNKRKLDQYVGYNEDTSREVFLEIKRLKFNNHDFLSISRSETFSSIHLVEDFEDHFRSTILEVDSEASTVLLRTKNEPEKLEQNILDPDILDHKDMLDRLFIKQLVEFFEPKKSSNTNSDITSSEHFSESDVSSKINTSNDFNSNLESSTSENESNNINCDTNNAISKMSGSNKISSNEAKLINKDESILQILNSSTEEQIQSFIASNSYKISLNEELSSKLSNTISKKEEIIFTRSIQASKNEDNLQKYIQSNLSEISLKDTNKNEASTAKSTSSNIEENLSNILDKPEDLLKKNVESNSYETVNKNEESVAKIASSNIEENLSNILANPKDILQNYVGSNSYETVNKNEESVAKNASSNIEENLSNILDNPKDILQNYVESNSYETVNINEESVAKNASSINEENVASILDSTEEFLQKYIEENSYEISLNETTVVSSKVTISSKKKEEICLQTRLGLSKEDVSSSKEDNNSCESKKAKINLKISKSVASENEENRSSSVLSYNSLNFNRTESLNTSEYISDELYDDTDYVCSDSYEADASEATEANETSKALEEQKNEDVIERNFKLELDILEPTPLEYTELDLVTIKQEKYIDPYVQTTKCVQESLDQSLDQKSGINTDLKLQMDLKSGVGTNNDCLRQSKSLELMKLDQKCGALSNVSHRNENKSKTNDLSSASFDNLDQSAVDQKQNINDAPQMITMSSISKETKSKMNESKHSLSSTPISVDQIILDQRSDAKKLNNNDLIPQINPLNENKSKINESFQKSSSTMLIKLDQTALDQRSGAKKQKAIDLIPQINTLNVCNKNENKFKMNELFKHSSSKTPINLDPIIIDQGPSAQIKNTSNVSNKNVQKYKTNELSKQSSSILPINLDQNALEQRSDVQITNTSNVANKNVQKSKTNESSIHSSSKTSINLDQIVLDQGSDAKKQKTNDLIPQINTLNTSNKIENKSKTNEPSKHSSNKTTINLDQIALDQRSGAKINLIPQINTSNASNKTNESLFSSIKPSNSDKTILDQRSDTKKQKTDIIISQITNTSNVSNKNVIKSKSNELSKQSSNLTPINLDKTALDQKTETTKIKMNDSQFQVPSKNVSNILSKKIETKTEQVLSNSTLLNLDPNILEPIPNVQKISTIVTSPVSKKTDSYIFHTSFVNNIVINPTKSYIVASKNVQEQESNKNSSPKNVNKSGQTNKRTVDVSQNVLTNKSSSVEGTIDITSGNKTKYTKDVQREFNINDSKNDCGRNQCFRNEATCCGLETSGTTTDFKIIENTNILNISPKSGTKRRISTTDLTQKISGPTSEINLEQNLTEKSQNTNLKSSKNVENSTIGLIENTSGTTTVNINSNLMEVPQNVDKFNSSPIFGVYTSGLGQNTSDFQNVDSNKSFENNLNNAKLNLNISSNQYQKSIFNNNVSIVFNTNEKVLESPNTKKTNALEKSEILHRWARLIRKMLIMIDKNETNSSQPVVPLQNTEIKTDSPEIIEICNKCGNPSSPTTSENIDINSEVPKMSRISVRNIKDLLEIKPIVLNESPSKSKFCKCEHETSSIEPVSPKILDIINLTSSPEQTNNNIISLIDLTDDLEPSPSSIKNVTNQNVSVPSSTITSGSQTNTTTQQDTSSTHPITKVSTSSPKNVTIEISQCRICMKKYSSKSDLRVHINNKHPKINRNMPLYNRWNSRDCFRTPEQQPRYPTPYSNYYMPHPNMFRTPEMEQYSYNTNNFDNTVYEPESPNSFRDSGHGYDFGARLRTAGLPPRCRNCKQVFANYPEFKYHIIVCNKNYNYL